MDRLTAIGFQLAGHWKLDNDELSFELLRHGSQRNILYAFISDGEVQYVGKTTQTLAKRMSGYKRPGKSQTTNIKNNGNIKQLLRAGATVEIFALPDNGLMHYGPFHLNLAAGLEDNIIAVLQPEWNGTPRSTSQRDEPGDEEHLEVRDTFPLIVQRTYFEKGFFNVPASHADSLAGDGDPIEIFCGQAEQPITGSINRRCNANNTPRVMGGIGLRDWLRNNVSVMAEVVVDVYSPNAIRIQTTR